MHRREFIQGAVAAPLVCALASSASQSQAWPTRNITMVVPFPPGGQADLAARPVAAALEKTLGRAVVVDNRQGAGGMIGNAVAARAEADGYTLLMTLSSVVILPEAERLFDRKPSYELDQLVPIARVLADPAVLPVMSTSPTKCSSRPPASSCCTCPTAAVDLRSPRSSAVRSTSRRRHRDP
jgi:tripartite-type tricarboxylate transporter receptor subunit TctC